MARIVTAMTTLGMVADTGPPPKFPLWAVFGVSDFDSAGRPLGGRAKDYEATLDRILSWHGHIDEPGIPLHKVQTNLGWHVTAPECAAALAALERWRETEASPPVFGERLVPFLRAAVLIDGFEVH